ncbi:MAG: glucose/arabinose dehydrogenase [Paraglaciecola sp.]|jgi:glucose/arabinose dehydrogenase
MPPFMSKLVNISLLLLGVSSVSAAESDNFTVTGSDGLTLQVQPLETFDSAWAMTFLPDGRSLVSEKQGTLWLLDNQGKKVTKVTNTPKVEARGQGGLGDIIIHPNFATNKLVFLSYIERDKANDNLSGAVVERALLSLESKGGQLKKRQIIWRQSPKMTGNGHYSHRLVISPDDKLFITSGDRQKFIPAQNMAMNLGKIVRINIDGSVPSDNPFYANGGVSAEIWSLGHRNPLGIAFDASGELWAHEMGPRDGDELNRIQRAGNYGYPHVSEGEHYSGVKIPSHADIPIYQEPAKYWVPAISPAGLIIYQGNYFTDWNGQGFMGGLSSQALVRVGLGEPSNRNKYSAQELARYEWGKRIREIEQGPGGGIFILEDGTGGRLLQLKYSN